MSRSRALIVCVCLVVALPAATTLSGAQDAAGEQASDIQALKQRIETLEKRLAAMEGRLRQLSQGAQGANPLEGEAQKAFGAINQTVASGDLFKAKDEMQQFMAKYGATNTARKATRLRGELAVIGKGTPTDWGIDKWFQGESDVNLSGDKTTVLVFWETWCPHCQREVPKLDALYTSLKGDGLQLVGLTKLTKSATEDKVREFIKQRGVSYPVAKENGSASRHFGVSGIPAAAVVKDGKVIWRGHPARLTAARVRGWL